jgi:hypothetical protein
MPERRTVRMTEIAELLGVTHQRASVIVRQLGFPATDRPPGSEPAVGSALGQSVGRRCGGVSGRGGSAGDLPAGAATVSDISRRR